MPNASGRVTLMRGPGLAVLPLSGDSVGLARLVRSHHREGSGSVRPEMIREFHRVTRRRSVLPAVIARPGRGSASCRRSIYLGLWWEPGDHRSHRTEGGDRIMKNTFRTGKGIVLDGDWPEPSVIRNNRFINSYHAVNIFGATAHVLDNHFSVPEPELVPIAGFPDEAVRIFPRVREAGDTLPAVCGRNVVAGNRIEGALIGIEIRVREADTSCDGNVIRDNWIAVTSARVPEWSPVPAPDDSRVVYGLALVLNDLAAESSGAESVTAAPRILATSSKGI